MAISASLIAKGIAGTLTLAAPVATSVYYKDNIYGLFVSTTTDQNSGQSPEQAKEKDPTTIIQQLGIGDVKAKKQTDHWELDLTSENLKKLKLFDTNTENTVEGLNSESVKLQIESINNDFFSEGFKFILTSQASGEVKIKKTPTETDPQITLASSKKVEFRLKGSSGNYYLEKLLSEEEMKNNLKLTCDNDSCTIQTNQKINVKEGDKKSEDVEFKTDQTDAKIKFEKYKNGYQNGFRFYVEKDIELSKTDSTSIEPDKLLKENTSYEAIKESDGKWFLSKKS